MVVEQASAKVVAARGDGWYAGAVLDRRSSKEKKRWATVKNLVGIVLFLGGVVLRLYCFRKYDDPWMSLRVVAQICIVLGLLVLIIPGKPPFGSLHGRRRW
jgi:hypothetical protein